MKLWRVKSETAKSTDFHLVPETSRRQLATAPRRAKLDEEGVREVLKSTTIETYKYNTCQYNLFV